MAVRPEISRYAAEVVREAVLTLRSTGVRHRFPTYTVPRATLSGVSLAAGGIPVAGSRREKIIQRQVHAKQGVWEEIADNRYLLFREEVDGP